MQAVEDWSEAERARVRALAARVHIPGASATIAVRAPGRVNLIGEHTDYSALPVLPVAIDRSTIIVAAPRDDVVVELRNYDARFAPRSFRVARAIEPYAPGDWGNYVKAAVQGVAGRFGATDAALDRMRGATMIVDGRVPVAAGLSSSAALTVASTLAFMAVNSLELGRVETAEMVALSERYVGTMSGGMDQAASLLGRREHALLIEFAPLRVTAVPLPRDIALVVAESRQVADKSGRVRDEYNRRVVECRLAARILARAMGLGCVEVLGDVVRALDRWEPPKLIAMLQDAAPERLDPGLSEAARVLGVERDTLAGELLGSGSSRISLAGTRPLEVLSRARHVLSEARRVIDAVEALRRGDLDEMGRLMNESHESLARDFECSTDRLDRMVEIARGVGALGARLTGAGFGGSIVALCRADDAEKVIDALDRDYYASLRLKTSAEDSRAVLHAGPGAGVIELA